MMDPNLLKQRQEFMKNAIKSMGPANKASSESSLLSGRLKKKRKKPNELIQTSDAKQSKAIAPSNVTPTTLAANFSLQHKIVVSYCSNCK